VQTGKSALQTEGLLRQQVLERCPLRRKDHTNDLSKQASQKSLILTRTSYLIVKEQPHCCGSPPPCGES